MIIREIKMKMNKFSLGLIAVLTAGMMAVPAFAAQTGAGGTTQEAAAAEEAEAEPDFLNPGRAWEVETDMEDQVYTIRIKARGSEKEGYHWENFTGDRGDATAIELLTQSTEEKGLAYAGSFRVETDQKTRFEDYIRLVYTNGISVDEYMDFNVLIEDGEFEEITGGCHCMPVDDDDYAKLIEGEWKDENGGEAALKLTQNPAGGFDGTLTNAKAKEFTFHADYDWMNEAYVYKKGEEGLGLVTIHPASESEDKIRLLMHDMQNAGDEDLTFVKAE